MRSIYATKDNIVKEYGEVNIISKMLNIPVSEINKCLASKSYRVSNTLRGDNHPSLGITFKSNGKGLYLYDFAQSLYRGDIFDFIGIRYGLNPNRGIEFKQILIKVVLLMDGVQIDNVLPPQKKLEPKIEEIKVVTRPFNDYDKHYWLNGFITEKDLKSRSCFPISSATYGDLDIYAVSKAKLAYAYIFARNKVNQIEIYMPYENKENKFKNNIYSLKVSPKIKESKNLILIKSYKDLIILEVIAEKYKLDYAVINLPSEGYIMDTTRAKILKDRYDKIFTFLDFDKQGITSMFLYNAIFDFEPICYYDDKELEFVDSELKAIVNTAYNYNVSVAPSQMFDFIEIIKALNIKSEHKDLYDNIRGNKKSITTIVNHIKSKIA